MQKISVVIPVYNVELYLQRCLDSISRQSFRKFDLILVDDGSTDRSGEICDDYAKFDDRVVVIHQKNGGLSCARNRGIEWAMSHSDSDWICFIDSDDWINETYLEGLYEAAHECESLISVCDFAKEEREEDVAREVLTKSILPSELYNNYFYVMQSACSKLFAKKLFENTEFRFTEKMLYEDSALIYRIVFTQKKIAFTNKSTYYYYQRPSSIVNSEWNPRKMVYCQVQRAQLLWLLSHNYDECVKTCLCHYLSALHYNESLIHGNHEYKKYAREMRKICREMLRKYGRKYEISIDEYSRFYEAGYPHLMQIYWVVKAQLKKIVSVRSRKSLL